MTPEETAVGQHVRLDGAKAYGVVPGHYTYGVIVGYERGLPLVRWRLSGHTWRVQPAYMEPVDVIQQEDTP